MAASVRVARCELYGPYVQANVDAYPGALKPEYRSTPLDALGGRCGIMSAGIGGFGSAGSESDLAVLQLVRPIPYEALDGVLSIAAERVFEDPIPLVNDPSAFSPSFDAMAVGFGGSTARQYQAVADVTYHASNVTAVGVLVGGDSGGPLLVETGSGPAVMGVAATGGGDWVVLSGDKLTWVRGQLDRDADGRVDTACGTAARGLNPGAMVSTDADGDGYLDAEDSCPSTYNPCQDNEDWDGDGTPDDCDACPNSLSVADLRGQAGPDADEDGIPDSCDCAAGTPESYYDDDDDRDFVLRGCDNCARLANRPQGNADEDAFGDACDTCPFTRAPHITDLDEDGVPDACDNCDVYNPAQANCNLDAELARGVIDLAAAMAGVGDACDPIPCGETLVESRTVADGITEETRMDAITVDARSAEPREARTGFRVCPCSAAAEDNLAVRDLCRDELVDGTGLCEPGLVDPYNRPTEDLYWRNSAMDITLVPVDIVATAHGDEGVVEYAPPAAAPGDGPTWDNDLAATWYWEADRDRWLARPSPWPTPTEPFAGVLWTHSPGPRSETEFFASEVRELSSHYWSGALVPPFTTRPPFPCFNFLGPFLAGPRVCPACTASYPSPAVALPGPGLCFDGSAEEPGIVSGGDWLDVALLFGENSVPEWFKGKPPEGGAWISVAEGPLGIQAGAVVHAFLNKSGTAITRMLAVDESGAYLDACPEGCPEPAASAGAITARYGFATAASASHHTVWIGGGFDDSGDPRGDAWAIDTRTLEARPLELAGEALDGIAALAYSPALDELYVLSLGEGEKYNLYRVDALGGELEWAQAWEASDLGRDVSLVGSEDGFLHVATSGEDGYCIVRMDQFFAFRDLTVGPEQLIAGSLRATARGVSTILFDGWEQAVVDIDSFEQYESGEAEECF